VCVAATQQTHLVSKEWSVSPDNEPFGEAPLEKERIKQNRMASAGIMACRNALSSLCIVPFPKNIRKASLSEEAND
jgi:hypothetical protein